ncbi:MAG: hypothetical protein WBQ25_02775 [Nitrososphaeraceae archaeon]
MDYSIYIDEISKCNTERLTEKERVVLAKIIKSAYSSGGISHYLKLKRHRVDFAEGPYLNNLIKKGFVETRRGNFLLEGTSYDLTACCLFYIFLNMRNYPNQLLLKYQDNIILKTLVYPYFTPNSIKVFYPLLSRSITHYLRLCCRTTLNLLKTMGKSSNSSHREKLRLILEYELEWHSRTLVIGAAMLADSIPQEEKQTNRVVSSQLVKDNPITTLLMNDDRFLSLFRRVKNEFTDGYKELSDLRRNYSRPAG